MAEFFQSALDIAGIALATAFCTSITYFVMFVLWPRLKEPAAYVGAGIGIAGVAVLAVAIFSGIVMFIGMLI